MPQPRRLLRAAIAVIALLACGCTALPASRGGPGNVPAVTLPLPLTSVRDERRAFARVFAAELAQAGPERADASAWLHGVTAAANGDAAGLVERVERAFRARASSTVVLIVPGMFGDCFDDQTVPFGDGRVRERSRSYVDAYGAFAELGLAGLRALPVAGRSSSDANGRVVAEALRKEAARPEVARIVVVGYSKGLPDTLHAMAQLEREGTLPRQLAAVVSLAGVVVGSPYADRFEALYESLAGFVNLLGCPPGESDAIASLTRRERLAWLVEHPLPAGIGYYSVTAHAPRAEVGLALRQFHDLLATSDPLNDGQVLASEAVLPGSVLLAEARADHWDVALPRDRHPSWTMRWLTSGRRYPRDALLRAIVKWAVANDTDVR